MSMATDCGPGAGDSDTPPDLHDYSNPQMIGSLMCEARGTAAQAACFAEHEPALTSARSDYDRAWRSYSAVRRDAAPKVQDMGHRVEQVLEQLRSVIEERAVRRLDEAFVNVTRRLEECEPVTARVKEYPLDLDVGRLDYAEIATHINSYEQHVAAAKLRFAQLNAEVTTLVKRVDDSHMEIDAVAASSAEHSGGADVELAYVAGLVARHRLESIWNGFAGASDYVACLSSLLTQWAQAVAILSRLTGAREAADCRHKFVNNRCADLRANLVDEVLAEYQRQTR